MTGLDAWFGQSAGSEVAGTILRILDLHGGLQGLVEQFDRQGLGEIVSSWVGTGANRRISAVQLYEALGAANVVDMAARAHMSVPELVHKLSAYLPLAVDKLTPNGVIPDA